MARRALSLFSENLVVVVTLEAATLPPGADVVPMIADVLLKTSCVCTLAIAARTNILRNEAIAQLAIPWGNCAEKRFFPPEKNVEQTNAAVMRAPYI